MNGGLITAGSKIIYKKIKLVDLGGIKICCIISAARYSSFGFTHIKRFSMFSWVYNLTLTNLCIRFHYLKLWPWYYTIGACMSITDGLLKKKWKNLVVS